MEDTRGELARQGLTHGRRALTAIFATGPVLTEVKVGALSTIGAALVAVAVGWTRPTKAAKS